MLLLEILIFIVTAIAVLASITSFIFALVSWLVHISMVKGHCDTYGCGNRKLFWEQFKKCELKRDRVFSSYFAYDENTKIISKVHAGIIEFNGIGMVLNPVDYLIVNYELYRMRKIEDKKKIYKWRETKNVRL